MIHNTLIFTSVQERGHVAMIDGIPIAGLTAPALVSIFVILMYMGRLVPKSTLDNEREEKERWRLAYEAEREARAAADAQTGELLEVTKTTQSFVRAVFANSERIRKSGDPDASHPTT